MNGNPECGRKDLRASTSSNSEILFCAVFLPVTLLHTIDRPLLLHLSSLRHPIERANRVFFPSTTLSVFKHLRSIWIPPLMRTVSSMIVSSITLPSPMTVPSKTYTFLRTTLGEMV